MAFQNQIISFRARGRNYEVKPASICVLAEAVKSFAEKTCCLPPLPLPQPRAVLASRSAIVHPFLSLQEEKTHIETRLSWARGCVGQALTSGLWSVIHMDSQNTALISNLANSQIEGENALSVSALCHWPCCQRGIKPYTGFFCWTQTFWEASLSACSLLCSLALQDICAHRDMLWRDSLFSWGSKCQPQSEEKHLPEIPRTELCEVFLSSTLFQCMNLSESYAHSGFVKAGADQIK